MLPEEKHWQKRVLTDFNALHKLVIHGKWDSEAQSEAIDILAKLVADALQRGEDIAAIKMGYQMAGRTWEGGDTE